MYTYAQSSTLSPLFTYTAIITPIHTANVSRSDLNTLTVKGAQADSPSAPQAYSYYDRGLT